MRTMRTACGLLFIGLLVSGCAAPAKVVDTGSLLAEMTDLRGLAEMPDPPFTCKQFSSYDRKSKAPDQPGPPTEGWFANADAAQYLRVEDRDGRKEYVMMDTEGPGAIVRIWSANPNGTLRIYLDGADVPALEAPMKEFLGGTMRGVPKPIAQECSRGWNSYLPIPYARHCKVTSDAGDFYYHVNYRTYPPETKVVSFSKDQIETLAPRIQEVARKLASPREGGAVSPTGADMLPRAVTRYGLRPGETGTPVRITGQKAISDIVVQVKAKDPVQALRHVLLDITFDGEQTVSVPLGDFFGAAPGVNAYASLPAGVTKRGEMWSHWVMPFRKSAEVRLRNHGEEMAEVILEVGTVPYRWTPRSAYFHAKWRTQFDVPTRPMIDWNYLTAQGQGTFVGVAFAIANPTKAWWGEGDEKIYFDGQTFPSHFGTGTEDYYGYAWCSPDLFIHAYHNQPRCDGPGNYGHTAVNRWHILDRIPFQKDFRFDMELWHWDEKVKVTMSVVAYWYARPGATDGFKAIQTSDLKLAMLPPYVALKVKDAIEGEQMKVIEKTAVVDPQPIGECSNESHMWWHDGCKVGDRLVLGFQVPQAGKYRVLARFVKAGDYGIVQMSVNGANAGDPVDLYNDGVVVSSEVNLGTFELTQGENRLGAEITGANEKAVKAYLFGLDYVRLEPAP